MLWLALSSPDDPSSINISKEMAQTAIWKTIAANEMGGGDVRNRYLMHSPQLRLSSRIQMPPPRAIRVTYCESQLLQSLWTYNVRGWCGYQRVSFVVKSTSLWWQFVKRIIVATFYSYPWRHFLSLVQIQETVVIRCLVKQRWTRKGLPLQLRWHPVVTAAELSRSDREPKLRRNRCLIGIWNFTCWAYSSHISTARFQLLPFESFFSCVLFVSLFRVVLLCAFSWGAAFELADVWVAFCWLVREMICAVVHKFTKNFSVVFPY